MIKVSDLKTFHSEGYGYLGHQGRTPISDETLVAAANEIGISADELNLWVDSSFARHAMNAAECDLRCLNKPDYFRVCLQSHLPILMAEIRDDPMARNIPYMINLAKRS